MDLAGIERRDDVLYCNSGDRVDRQLRLLEWTGLVQELPPAAASLPVDRPEGQPSPAWPPVPEEPEELTTWN